MTDKNPFENIFYRIEELLKIIDDAQHIKFSQTLPTGVEEALQAIEKDVALFSKLNEDAFIKAGLNSSEIKELSNKTPVNLSLKSKRIFQLGEKLKLELNRKKLSFSHAKNRKKMGLDEKDPLKSALKRKKRFKGMGGDQNWIPL